MTRTIDEKNRRARQVNPTKSGIRTGNPQLESHEPDEVWSSPRQRAPRGSGAKALVKQGKRRSD